MDRQRPRTQNEMLAGIEKSVGELRERVDSLLESPPAAQKKPWRIFAPLRWIGRLRRWYIPRLARYLEVIMIVEFAILYFFLCSFFGGY